MVLFEEADIDPMEEMAREHFYCPGPFHKEAFARDYARFLIVRKQFSRYLNSGQININLAINNCIVLLNSFGKYTVNEIFSKQYSEPVYELAGTVLFHLGVVNEGFRPNIEFLNILTKTRKSNQYRTS